MRLSRIFILVIVIGSLCLLDFSRASDQAEVRIDARPTVESKGEPDPGQEYPVEGYELKDVILNNGGVADLKNTQLEADSSVDSIATPITSFEGINLNEYFKSLGNLEKYQGIEVIKNLPMTTYFDVIKGDFRLGVIGDHIVESYPQLLSFIDRRVVVKGKTYEAKKLPVLNNPIAFMYMLGAIQDMDMMLLELEKQAREARKGATAYVQEVDDVIAIGKKAGEYEHANVTAAHIEAVRSKTALYEGLVAELRLATATRMQGAVERQEGRLALRQKSEEELLAVYKQHMHAIATEKARSLESVGAEREGRARAAFAQEVEELSLELEVQAARLADEVQQVVDGSKIRVEEAFRVASETEQTLLNIVQAESDSQAQELEAYVRTLFAESRLVFLSLFGDVQSLAFHGSVVVLAIIAVVIVQELVAGTRFILSRLGGREATLRYQQARDGEAPAIQALPVPPVLKRRCSTLARTLHEVSRSELASSMPFSLLYGPKGTGQGDVAEAIARDSGLRYAMVETRDVVGVGTGAGIYLQRLIEKHVRKRRPFLLVLHDADEIIAARGLSTNHSSDQSAARGCLYALLQALKLNNPCVAVLLTASMPLQSVDAAVLNRLDSVLELPLPDKGRRVAYCLHLVGSRLSRHLEESSLADVAEQLQLRSEAVGAGGATPSPAREAVGAGGATPSPARARKDIPANWKDVGSPETHIPTSPSSSAVKRGNQAQLKKATAALEKTLGRCRDSLDFDIAVALAHLSDLSEGWSLQDIEGLVDRSMAAALGTEACKVTTRLFLSELAYIVEAKQQDFERTE